MPNLFYNPNLPEKLKSSGLVIDTNVLVQAAMSPELQELLISIRKAGCFVFTTSNVRSEFLRGAASLENRNNLERLFGELGVPLIQGIDSNMFSKEAARFQLLLHKLVPKASIPDEELLFIAAKYKVSKNDETVKFGVKLLSGNHKDVPPALYECEDVISIYGKGDGGKGEVRSLAIYSIKTSRFNEKMADIQ